ncbi:3-hydroxyacyl-CoA dehydrogenase family protein [Tropicibacter naphthalenivorans]|uniref:3-hydroxyadipyl-CoA dehydrogenase n=1 Tax=Tropicibacter naphthalenivorans TaxID=441103 RepID=A0A0P1GYP1_9RHOB|nr:3-hydroxyacyl-CoA dehydrogenase family protein [Tropicibacter naphthalenivorans]CUH81141.1 3-hydroxyadipyl-CoA dehydrogenase [Tropicibacter naphthalenivorans]SMC97346.1 3-hydroxyacyl-CoA dehydrogenase [Tropicibacter naphthalenivorans]
MTDHLHANMQDNPTDATLALRALRRFPDRVAFRWDGGEQTILASNTSSLSIASIAKNCAQKDRVVGMHFFNPVPLMKLVEVIPGAATSADVTETTVAVSKQMGKVPVIAKDGPGFIVNLGGRAYYTEGLHIEAEGVAPPEQIDRIMKMAGGFRMGPFELMDLTGIDTNYPVSTFIFDGYHNDARLRTTPRHGYMVEAGRLGRKVGQGFYDYSQDLPKLPVPPEAGPVTELAAHVPGQFADAFGALADKGLNVQADNGTAPILVAPLGEDCTTVVHRLGLDARRTVAVDLSGAAMGIVTVMTAPGGNDALEGVTSWLQGAGLHVEVIKDSPGFVAPRIIAMIVNLCCEMAQIGVGSPEDLGKAMTMGLNYPMNPLSYGDEVGRERLLATMQGLQAVTGSERYRPSLWLRRRAMLGLSLMSAD